MARRFKPAKDGEWIAPKVSGYRMACCDCGLVHRMDFVFMTDKGRHKILFRAYRDKTNTKLMRRRMKKQCPLPQT